VDDQARTITFHLVARDTSFVEKLALPFAVAVPRTVSRGKLRRFVPATGPYRFTRIDAHGSRLERNPWFGPVPGRLDGYADAIDFRYLPTRAALQAVERGAADYVNGVALILAKPADVTTVFTRYAGQVHTPLLPSINYMYLNTRRPPFDDVGVRRAVNFALDRGALLRATGGDRLQLVTCQLLPPNFPGYRGYCPYTAHAGPGRQWSAPDMARARALVARSHTKGMKITVWGATTGLNREPRFVAATLRALGYQAHVKLLPLNSYQDQLRDPRHTTQVGIANWGADYPSPATFLQTLFGCAALQGPPQLRFNRSNYCDPRAEQLERQAGRLPAGGRAADAAWARAEHYVVDQAPAIPLTASRQGDLVSARVRHYAYNPQLGPLLDQLWVR
jgi:peptide/nickel transport system substrate-binding protein